MVPASYPAPIQPGDVIRGKYRVERLLGTGGMAYVVAALHLHLGQRVAIKLLRPETVQHPEVVQRFLREARASSRLESPHVARVTDVDVLDGGAPFIVMEYLEGEDLSQVLASRGPVPVPDAAGWVREACAGVAEAHALGIVHRDLKPANLFLAQKRGERVVKVLDFGISKLLEDTRLTQSEVGMGSAEYMSPEQMRSAADVDVRGDVWSLGVTLYELTTGKTPFHADGVGQVAIAILTKDPAPPRSVRPELPPSFEAVVMRCLEKDPGLRYPSASALADALAPFVLAASAPAASAPSPVTPAPRTLVSGVPPRPLPPTISSPIAAPAQTTPWASSSGLSSMPKPAPAPPRAAPWGIIAGAGLSVLAAGVVAAAFAFGRQGAPGAASSASAVAGRYTIDGATVRDASTGLVWQRAPAPGNLDWESAKEHCARQKGGFRLPDIDELSGLVPITKASPPADPSFTTTPADVFWSSSPAGRGAAMVIHFSTGKRGTSVVSGLNRVRCVR
jgi:eukaryotic-like serine/threonine-protein kinase